MTVLAHSFPARLVPRYEMQVSTYERPTFPADLNLANYFLFDRIAEGHGHKPALLYGDRVYTYELVAQRSHAFAALLHREGIRRGERVLVILPDSPPFAWAIFGILARGAVLAMGNPDAPHESLDYLVGYTRATAIVTIPRIAAELTRTMASTHVGREVQKIFVVPDTETGDDPEAPTHVDTSANPGERMMDLATALATVKPLDQAIPVHRDEPCIWLFTSGSTGEPRANVHTHRDFAYSTEVYAKRTVGYRASDVSVSVSRLFFGYATGTNLFFPFAVGATVGLFSERPTVDTLIKNITMYKATIVTNVPTMLGKILDQDDAMRAQARDGSDAAKGLDFSQLRFSLSAGEALPGPLLERWNARFRSDVYDGIGSAEMFHIYASNRPGDIKPGSLGKVVEGYELLILPEDAEGPGATPCAPGEIGVLWVKGDSVSQSYWLDRDRSWQVFHGHWCRTGDLFTIDADGYLYFSGRADDLLKVGGQWVAPVEVEECILRHDAVSLAAIIGVEDDGLLKPKAFVILKSGRIPEGDEAATLVREIQELVKRALAPHKYPRVVEFILDVPKNDRGKVDRKALRALHVQNKARG